MPACLELGNVGFSYGIIIILRKSSWELDGDDALRRTVVEIVFFKNLFIYFL